MAGGRLNYPNPERKLHWTSKIIPPHNMLNVMYKFLTANMTEILYKHTKEVGTIPYEQRALVCKKRVLGCSTH